MQKQIEAILEPFKRRGIDAGCEHDGTFWQVWIGSKGGARKDGVSLAKFLAAEDVEPKPVRPEPAPKVRNEPASERPDAMAKAVPVDAPIPIPEFLAEPEAPDPRLDLQAARIAELEAALAEKEAPEPTVVPLDLAEFVRVGETYEQTNERLLPAYREAQHMKERAIEDGDKKARVHWETKIRKIDLAVHWMHGRLIETV